MKRALYVTYDWWFDTDVDILRCLSTSISIDVYVISIKEKKLNKYPDKTLDISNVVIHDFVFWDKDNKLRLALNSFRFVSMVLSKVLKADLILYMDDSNPFTAFLFSLFLPVKKTIVTYHDYQMHGDEPFFKRMVHDILKKSFKHFHFFSKSQYSLFKTENPKKTGFFSLMPLKDFGYSPTMKMKKSAVRTFLFFGYIRDYKRLDLFIKASKRVTGESRFIIAGYCQDWDVYEKMIDGDKRFECSIQFIPNSDIPNYFADTDYLVLPYSDSTQSGPLLIALNYGIPVIASDHQIFKDFIHPNINGYLFQNGDEAALFEVMQQAVNLSSADYDRLVNAMKNSRDEYLKKSDYIATLNEYLKANMQS